MGAQGSPGEHREAQGSPREPTRDQDSPEEHRKAEERQFWMGWPFWMGIRTCNVTMGTCAPGKAPGVLMKC